CANRPDEDPGVTLLADVRTVFEALGFDRIASLTLVETLIGLDDGLWNEWHGPNDDRPPRKLTQGELSRLLRPFGIRPKTTLLRAAPSLRSGSVLSPSRLEPLVACPLASENRFTRSIRKPGRASRRLHAGCRSGRLRHLPS